MSQNVCRRSSASLELRGIENLAQDFALCQGRTRSWEARLKLEADARDQLFGLKRSSRGSRSLYPPISSTADLEHVAESRNFSAGYLASPIMKVIRDVSLDEIALSKLQNGSRPRRSRTSNGGVGFRKVNGRSKLKALSIG